MQTKSDFIQKLVNDIKLIQSKEFNYWMHGFDHTFNKISMFKKDYMGICLDHKVYVKPPSIMFYSTGNISVFKNIDKFLTFTGKKALRFNKLVYYPLDYKAVLFGSFTEWLGIVNQYNISQNADQYRIDKIREWHVGILDELNKDMEILNKECEPISTNKKEFKPLF